MKMNNEKVLTKIDGKWWWTLEHNFDNGDEK